MAIIKKENSFYFLFFSFSFLASIFYFKKNISLYIIEFNIIGKYILNYIYSVFGIIIPMHSIEIDVKETEYYICIFI